MASVNKAIILGNLGHDPDFKTLESGKAFCTLSVATTERYKAKDGEKKETTTWHKVVLWERLAEIAHEYLKKGNPVYIEGRIVNRSYEDKDGVKKYITEIVGQSLQLLGKAPAKAEDTPTLLEDEEIPF